MCGTLAEHRVPVRETWNEDGGMEMSEGSTRPTHNG